MVLFLGFELDANQMDVLALGTWLLKDAGWVLLCPFVAWPAALGAIGIESYNLLIRHRQQSGAELVHSAATFIWLIGNAVWMTSELLFQSDHSHGRQLPWFSGPLAGEGGKGTDQYDKGVSIARGIFTLALVLLGVLYLRCFVDRMLKGKSAAIPVSQDQADGHSEMLVFGMFTPQLYGVLYIGPWILKDLFWTFEFLVPAVCSSVLVIAIIVDCIRRFADFVFVAELCWAFGNLVWIFGEIALNDEVVWPRFLAASFLCIGLVALCIAWRQSDTAYRVKKAGDPHEATSLLGKATSSKGAP